MRWLVRLYPRWWRERYADEFKALLRQRPSRPLDAMDILRSALDARLHLKAERARPINAAAVGTGLGIAAGALLLVANARGGWPFGRSGTVPSVRLYALVQTRGERLLPIDPIRLTSISRGQGITLAPSHRRARPFEVLQSDDGHIIAAVSSTAASPPPFPPTTTPCDVVPRGRCLETIRIFEARTGLMTASFRLPLGTEVQGLSPDGSELFSTQLRQVRMRQGWWPAWTRWYAISTTSGQIVNQTDLPLPPSTPTLYDPLHSRLYALQASRTSKTFVQLLSPQIQGALGEGTTTGDVVDVPWSIGPTKPGPPTLLAYDLASSRHVTRLALPGVTFGSWNGQSWTPGLALSPDGRQIALYDDRTNRLTLVDALRMTILRSETLSRPESLASRLVERLGIAPTEAFAKGELGSGAEIQMRYSPNGRQLYVTGNEYSPQVRIPCIGVRVIDPATGVIKGETLAGDMLAWIQPAPDGSAVYALSLYGVGAVPFLTLLRLDPYTLDVTAQQVITPYNLPYNLNPQFYVLASSGR